MEIYNLKLHETTTIFGETTTIRVTRVPGGWIYEIPRGNTNRVSSQFVPYNGEFEK